MRLSEVFVTEVGKNAPFKFTNEEEAQNVAGIVHDFLAQQRTSYDPWDDNAVRAEDVMSLSQQLDVEELSYVFDDTERMALAGAMQNELKRGRPTSRLGKVATAILARLGNVS